jgi:hypothetical protein
MFLKGNLHKNLPILEQYRSIGTKGGRGGIFFGGGWDSKMDMRICPLEHRLPTEISSYKKVNVKPKKIKRRNNTSMLHEWTPNFSSSIIMKSIS